MSRIEVEVMKLRIQRNMSRDTEKWIYNNDSLVYLKYNSNLEPAIAQSRNISRTNHSTFLTLSNANALFRNFNLVVFSNKNSKITKKSFRKNNSVVFLLK